MKRTITNLLGCIALVCLFAACNSKNVLLKRHYMKGYYLSHGGAKNDVAANVGRPHRHAVQGVTTVSKNETVTQYASESNAPAIAAAASTKAETQKHGSLSSLMKTKPVRKLYSLAPVSFKKQFGQNAFKPVRSDDGGLSLFWVVILILLILWAIGWLTGGFGLGNLIHILLVIALVLLILWLLHII